MNREKRTQRTEKKTPPQKFGIRTAYVLTVGTVIGSGVFFKAPVILEKCGGDALGGLLAWGVGAMIMLICALAIAGIISGRGEGADTSVPGLADAMIGPQYARYTASFLSRVYYPSLTAVLAFVGASYTAELLFPAAGDLLVLLLAVGLIVLSFIANKRAAGAADRFRTVVTAAKLLPLLALAVIGTARGTADGTLSENFSTPMGTSFLAALPAAAFAYEGWIAPAAIGQSLVNPQRTLPIALTAGALTVTAVYILYYLGLTGALPAEELIENGTSAAFRSLFGETSSLWLIAAVAISCIGTLSGLSLATARAAGDLSGALFSVFWLFWYYFAQMHPAHPLGVFSFDNSELPVITLYALYIPLFWRQIQKSKHRTLPILGIIAAAGMILSAAISHKAEVLPYLLLSGALILYKYKERKP